MKYVLIKNDQVVTFEENAFGMKLIGIQINNEEKVYTNAEHAREEYKEYLNDGYKPEEDYSSHILLRKMKIDTEPSFREQLEGQWTSMTDISKWTK